MKDCCWLNVQIWKQFTASLGSHSDFLATEAEKQTTGFANVAAVMYFNIANDVKASDFKIQGESATLHKVLLHLNV